MRIVRIVRRMRRRTKRKAAEAVIKTFVVVDFLDGIGLAVDESVLPWLLAEHF